ncbi:MAG TPA: iron-containing alcohol dehydrogenase, partial [Pseudonocardiaceae bacterium]|nr:iron-containing alcohol dehydrogenase [Pseudonocardiaceae bacterium]
RANALVAPTALAALADTAPDRHADLGRLLSTSDDPPHVAFAALRAKLGVPAPLSDYGVPRADLPRLAKLATAFGPVLRNTPRDFTEAELCELYLAAWAERGSGS